MKNAALKEMETLFLALADKTRLRLLNLMRESEVCVYYFTEVLGESQPKISRHLAYLKNAAIVSARRDGKWIHYKIVSPENEYAAQVLQDTLEWLASQKEMQDDYKKLESICGSVKSPATSAATRQSETFAKLNMNVREDRELEIFML